MTLDISSAFTPPREFRPTGRSLSLALLAIGVAAATAGVWNTLNAQNHRARGMTVEPLLRGKLDRLANNAIQQATFAAPQTSSLMRAQPFILKARSPAERARAVQCLANAVYYEAALEPLDGQRAVAQVVVNRVRNVNFPHSICGVVYEGWDRPTGCQFSFTCDGSLLRPPEPALLAQARRVAEQALSGYVMPDVGTATHYHATSVDPWWRSTVVKVAQEGTQIFYRWPGGSGLAGAFSAAYGGGELKLSQAVIDGRATRATPAPGQKSAAPGGDGSLGGAALAIGAQLAQGAHRIHVVAYMSAARRTPTPEEVAQINAGAAKLTPHPPLADKPDTAATASAGPSPAY
jgi:spore germination cell wall hydrolase CwlJ-like protein